MIRRAFLQTVALSVGLLPGWLKRVPSQVKAGDFDITCPSGWTVTHRINKDGLHVVRSTRVVTREQYNARGGFALCDTPPLMRGLARSIDVCEDIYKRHWDICITDREIEKGGRIVNLNVMDGGTIFFK